MALVDTDKQPTVRDITLRLLDSWYELEVEFKMVELVEEVYRQCQFEVVDYQISLVEFRVPVQVPLVHDFLKESVRRVVIGQKDSDVDDTEKKRRQYIHSVEPIEGPSWFHRHHSTRQERLLYAEWIEAKGNQYLEEAEYLKSLTTNYTGQRRRVRRLYRVK